MLTQVQIKFLNRVCPNNWAEENGIINVEGKVRINYMNLTKIPVQFGQVNGYFDCVYNQLLTLEGGPRNVHVYYTCDNNNLANLIGAPEICDGDFYCMFNQLTSLEGCPQLVNGIFNCRGNPNLEYLWGIGRVKGKVDYTNKNEINEWIIASARKGIIFPYLTLEENINWIKQEQKYSCLLGAPEKIREHFSPRILNLVDSGVFNESKILDYKKFSRIC